MSSSWKGRDDGRRDGEFDASYGITRRPRPRFVSALLSDRYRHAYMAAYRRSYDDWCRRNEDQIAMELAGRSKLISGEQVPRDQVFERGWRDGFDGKDTPPEGLNYDDVKTYERGHGKGRQHREWDLAHKLREKNRHQLSR